MLEERPFWHLEFRFASQNPYSWWLSSFIGCISLGVIFATAQMSKYALERVIVGFAVSLASIYWLYTIIASETNNRMEYQSIIPFVVGLGLAVPVAIWLPRKVAAGWKRSLARGIVFTLFLAPIPFGPEGSLMPLIVTLIYPPLLFMYLFRVVLVLLSGFSLFTVLDLIIRQRCLKEGLTHDAA